MATRYGGFGAVLQRGDGSTPTEVFASIAGVTDIKGPEISLDMADATAHDSPGAFEEKVPTIIRTGSVTFSIRWDPADVPQNVLRTDLTSRVKHNWKVIWPDAGNTTWDFEAYVTKVGPTAPYADVLGADIELTMTGQPNFAGS